MAKLSKTDTVIQNEQNQILKNRHKLLVGQKYSYKELVEVLEIKYKSGESKRLQVEKIKQYIEWGEDFVVRDNNIEIDEINGGGVKKLKSKYTEYAKGIILYQLAHDYLKEPRMEKQTLSKSKAIEFMRVFSDSFNIAQQAGDEVVAEVLRLEPREVRQFMSFARSKAIDIFESVCRDSEKRDIVVWQHCTIIRREIFVPSHVLYGKGGNEDVLTPLNLYAREEDIDEIKLQEQKILKKMGLKSHFQASVLGRYPELKKRVCKEMHIGAYWKAYDININIDIADKIVQKYKNKIDELVNHLKIEFMQSIIKSNAKVLKLKPDNNQELLEKLCNIFIFGDKSFNDSVEVIVARNNEIAKYKQNKNMPDLHKEDDIVKAIDNIVSQEAEELKILLKDMYGIDLVDSKDWNEDEAFDWIGYELEYENEDAEYLQSENVLEQCPYIEMQEEEWGIEGISSRECSYYKKWKVEVQGMGLFTDVFDPSECPHLEEKEELGLQVDEVYKHKCPYIIKKSKEENWKDELYRDDIRQYIINEFSSEFEE